MTAEMPSANGRANKPWMRGLHWPFGKVSGDASLIAVIAPIVIANPVWSAPLLPRQTPRSPLIDAIVSAFLARSAPMFAAPPAEALAQSQAESSGLPAEACWLMADKPNTQASARRRRKKLRCMNFPKSASSKQTRSMPQRGQGPPDAAR